MTNLGPCPQSGVVPLSSGPSPVRCLRILWVAAVRLVEALAVADFTSVAFVAFVQCVLGA